METASPLEVSLARLRTLLAHPPELEPAELAFYRHTIFETYFECRQLAGPAADVVLADYLAPLRERMIMESVKGAEAPAAPPEPPATGYECADT